MILKVYIQFLIIIKLHLTYNALNLNMPLDKFNIATLTYFKLPKLSSFWFWPIFLSQDLILANLASEKCTCTNLEISRFGSLYHFSENYLPLISFSSTIGCSIFCLYKSLFCLKGTIFLTLFGTNWDLQMFKMVNDITKNSINLIVQWCLSD